MSSNLERHHNDTKLVPLPFFAAVDLTTHNFIMPALEEVSDDEKLYFVL